VGKQDFAFRRFNEYIPGYTLYQIKKCPIPGSEKMFPTKLEAQQLFSRNLLAPQKAITFTREYFISNREKYCRAPKL
jgi:hypothetical protein